MSISPDLPYRHLPFADSVGTGLPAPFADPFSLRSDSGCHFYDKWVCSNGTDSVEAKGMIPLPKVSRYSRCSRCEGVMWV